MGVAICQFQGVNLRGVDFGELYLCLRSNAYKLDSPPEGKLLDARGKPIIYNDSISIEGSPDNASIEFASALLHGPDEVDHGQSLVILEFLQHVPDGQILLVNVTDFDELC